MLSVINLLVMLEQPKSSGFLAWSEIGLAWCRKLMDGYVRC